MLRRAANGRSHPGPGIRVLVFLLVAGTAGVAEAHPSGLRAGDPWWRAWNLDWLVLLNLILMAGLYGYGLRNLWRRAGVGRGVARWRAAAFAGGLLAILVALMSPMDALSDDLSWVHMLQHLFLMAVAAPLLVIGYPELVMLWVLPPRARQAVGHWPQRNSVVGALWRASWTPLLIWVVHALAVWVWHLPVLYEMALYDPLVHDIEHLTFFLAAFLFWRVAIDPRSSLRLNPGLGVLYLFTTSLHASALGALMTLSPHPWYSVYIGRTEVWNLTPLEDQQLAGLIMWMPGCTVYALAAVVLLGFWLRSIESPRRSLPARQSAPGLSPVLPRP
jgi:putative membrane protein